MVGTFERRIDGRYDKLLFIAAFAVGTCGIVLGRLFGVAPLLVMAIPVTILIAYTAYILLTPRFAASLDRAGDNLYYLGLLFTLVSLVYALLVVSDIASEEPSRVTLELISSFGIALVSTIAGMFLRVFVQQFHDDPVDVERHSRIELGEAMRRVRNELYRMISDVNTYRRAVMQSIEEAGAELAQGIQRSTAQTSQAVRSATEQLTETADTLRNVAEGQATSVQQAIDTALNGIDRVVAKLNGLELDPRTISGKFDELAEATAELLGSIRGLVDDGASARAELRKLIETLRAFGSEDLRRVLDEAVVSISQSAQRIRETEEQLQSLNEQLAKFVEGVKRHQSEEFAAMSELSDRLRAQVEVSQSMTEAVQESLVSAARKLRDEINRA